MKKQLQNLTVILLICGVLLSVTACRKNEGTSSKAESNISGVSSVTDDTANTEDIEFEPTDITEDEGTSSKKEDTSDDDDFGNFNFDFNAEDTPLANGNKKEDSFASKPDAEENEIYTVDKNDKPYVKYPAYLEYPMKSNYDTQATAMRNTVLSYRDKLPKTVTGTVWYISNDGKNTNSGKSPKEAWGSIFAMNFNQDSIKAGDAVLFERGGVYRGSFVAKSGVYYGAYGTGDKPCIYGSEQNYAKVTWTYKNANIWVCDAPFASDIGLVVFNHGEKMGYKKDKNYGLEKNGDFWCDSQNNYKLYMYMDKNPAKAYKSIEIGVNKSVISIYANSKDITIENLCIKYTGSMGIGVSDNCKNLTVCGCEIGFIGGSYLSGTLRYGNAIEIWAACDNVVIENNWIYQVYDSGITHQGGEKYIAKDIMMRKNLIEYCGLGSYEYWLASEWDIGRGENITFADNICRFAGYCWGGDQRPDKVSTHIRADVTCRNTIFNFKITGNIFDQASANLLEIGGTAISVENIPQSPEPVLSGNIYAQNSDGYLGTYFSKSGVIFDEDREVFIKEFMGDSKAEIYVY